MFLPYFSAGAGIGSGLQSRVRSQMTMTRWLVAMAAAVGILFSQSACADAEARWKAEQIAHLAPLRDTSYRNGEYGFSAVIPRGVQAYKARPPTPNHGIRLILGHQRTIEVSAVFDAPKYGCTKIQLDQSINSEQPDHVERSAAELGGKPAEKAVLTKGNSIMIIVARRRDEGGILYELELTTTPASRAKDAAVFDLLVAQFRERKRE